ncbi:hypothetical protein P7C70_g1687, partial [Phenoliferia sp. Uapishka_3]
MADPLEHAHSGPAYEMLCDFQVGVIGAEEAIVNPDFEFTDGFKPEDTEVEGDYEKNKFLDLNRPLIMQVWNSNFSKGFYLQQVHQPRHLPGSAQLFGPWYLEMFTRTPWYMVPIFWMPIAIYLFYSSVQQQPGVELATAVGRSGACFLLGNFIWTILEYGMHRFLFHIDDHLPDHYAALTLHFLLHGIHHYIPMDRLRLVMPPTLFGALQYPFTQLAYAVFPRFVANGVISGAFFFYVGYDSVHYALHHTKLPSYIRQIVRRLLTPFYCHHYKEPNMGFGVTSPFWDKVFGTEFVSLPKAAASPSAKAQ